MQSIPVAIERTDRRSLRVQWSDGMTFEYPYGKLREACPCATCREKRKAEENRPRGSLQVLKLEEAAPLDILQMMPVGNYAYNIAFSDGHSSGLFTMELLRELGMVLANPISSDSHASSSSDSSPLA